jgi:hypothetical protein
MLNETASPNSGTLFSLVGKTRDSKTSSSFSLKSSPIIVIDFTSSVFPHTDHKNETFITEEAFRKEKKIAELSQEISKMLDEIIREKNLQGEIDKEELLNSIMTIFRTFTLRQLEISNDELYKRIKDIVLWESLFGILNELSPEDVKDFEEMVKRRPLFK